MRRHKDLFEDVRRHPGMYLVEDSFPVAAAFVLGYDLANEGGILAGFREWLVVRLGGHSNLGWTGLVLDVAFPGKPNPEAELAGGVENQRRAISTMWDLLLEFEAARQGPDGLRKILVAYDRWEAEQRKLD